MKGFWIFYDIAISSATKDECSKANSKPEESFRISTANEFNEINDARESSQPFLQKSQPIMLPMTYRLKETSQIFLMNLQNTIKEFISKISPAKWAGKDNHRDIVPPIYLHSPNRLCSSSATHEDLSTSTF
ncbi:hypothetical protein CEXT_479061 [Caerostris extrusa]|uniref:Uncharacterized protein n=1 Tax=Caerostris extrusa TaxID=172846 RepID=A0AAV4UKZ0_CAEEX|nr:hypothetical protein CEXT_479061 [Caerostris extrusa]